MSVFNEARLNLSLLVDEFDEFDEGTVELDEEAVEFDVVTLWRLFTVEAFFL